MSKTIVEKLNLQKYKKAAVCICARGTRARMIIADGSGKVRSECRPTG